MSAPPPRILVVDDEPAIRSLLVEMLEVIGQPAVAVAGAPVALERLSQEEFDLVLSDVRMPDMNGLELLDELKRRSHPAGVVLLTACNEVPLAVRAMQLGALDYVVKPFTLDTIRLVVSRAMERQRELSEERQRSELLAVLVGSQQATLQRTVEQLALATEATLDALVAALDARERETRNHSQRVSRYALGLAQRLGLREEECEAIRRGSLLHDIGKIGVPDRILLKSGPLSGEEWEQMRRHPEIGQQILQAVESLRPAAPLVLHHHESFDGSGYPEGLRGGDIPLSARIFAVADTFDAMTSDRPYRSALAPSVAAEEIRRCRGSQFDPLVVDAFLGLEPAAWLTLGLSAPRHS